ncbi:MAG: biotin transporter BioY [Spirochaetota bacterium]
MALETLRRVRGLVLLGLAIALIIAGAYLIVPIPGSPVPVVLQNLFVVAAGMLLGPVRGGLAVAIYLLMGAVGLPVFSGGGGGLGHLAGPTGGYLVGFPAAALAAGTICRGTPRPSRDVLGAVVGMLMVYLVGVPRLKAVLDISWGAALTVGFFPFLIGDALKAAAAVGAVRLARRALPEIEVS